MVMKIPLSLVSSRELFQVGEEALSFLIVTRVMQRKEGVTNAPERERSLDKNKND